MNVLKRTLLFVVLIVPVALFSAQEEQVVQYDGVKYRKDWIYCNDSLGYYRVTAAPMSIPAQGGAVRGFSLEVTLSDGTRGIYRLEDGVGFFSELPSPRSLDKNSAEKHRA